MLGAVHMRANPGNYEVVASEFLRSLRGARSQRAFARRLGYRANPITDWEHARRFPTAEEALRAASVVGVDVAGAFARFHPAALTPRGRGRYDLAPWIDAIRGSTSVLDLARRTGLSRFAVSRYLRGAARPRLPEFFGLVDAATDRLPDLVASLVPIEGTPSLSERHAAAVAARRAAYDAPWTEAVLRVLESRDYGALKLHDDAFIATRLGIPLEQVRSSLSLLGRTGVIRRRAGIYRIRKVASVDTRGDRERVDALLRHWSEVGRDRIPSRDSTDLFAYNVFSLSNEDLERVRGILVDAFREIRSLVAASEPVERVAALNIQLFRLDRG
jgi:transcriptional regulator with XRE-family HTH domain